MDETFKVYVDRLYGGKTLEIEETTSPSFLEVDDPEASFCDPVHFKGQAYLADGSLIVSLSVDTLVEMPCIICGNRGKQQLALNQVYLMPEKEETNSGIFDFSRALREEIILETPKFFECSNGNCPERGELEKYTHKERAQQPFKDLL